MSAKPIRVVDKRGHWIKVAMASIRNNEVQWLTSVPIKLEDSFRDNAKGRKELIIEWKRLLNDLEKAPVYEESLDGTFKLKVPGKWS